MILDNWRALIVNGTTTPDFAYVRKNNNINNFVDMTSLDFRCDAGAQASAKSTKVATVVAGSEVGMTNLVGAAHIGPVMFYMSKATNGDDTTYDGSGDWFKVYQIGPTVSGGRLLWTTNNMASFTFTIPKDLPDGQYLLRGERLALHIANQPQWYVGVSNKLTSHILLIYPPNSHMSVVCPDQRRRWWQWNSRSNH
jgi:hypothetical protein